MISQLENEDEVDGRVKTNKYKAVTSSTPVSKSTQLGELVAEYAWQLSSP